MHFSKCIAGFRILHLPETESTNTDMLAVVEADEPEGLVILADRQRQGRGRQGRLWLTTPQSSLAFSVLFRPSSEETKYLARFSYLAGRSIINAIEQLTGEKPLLKWPNDVLMNGRKISGVLIEAVWEGCRLKGLVMGLGVNVGVGSIPTLPDLIFPASSIESECGHTVDRWALFTEILNQLSSLRREIGMDSFMEQVNSSLAFSGEVVPIRNDTGELLPFRLLKIDLDGALIVSDSEGLTQRFYSAELSSSSSSE